MGVVTMGFRIFIITHNVYVVISFKSTTSSLSRAHIAHLSAPTNFKYLSICCILFCFHTNQHLNTGIAITILHMVAANCLCQEQNTVTIERTIIALISGYDVTQAELMLLSN